MEFTFTAFLIMITTFHVTQLLEKKSCFQCFKYAKEKTDFFILKKLHRLSRIVCDFGPKFGNNQLFSIKSK